MTAHQLTTLIIRLLGVVWFLFLLGHAAGLAVYIGGDAPLKPGTGFVLALTLVQFIGCAAFWLLPASIAARLLPSILSDMPRPASTPLQWQTLGVVCIGLWDLSRALPDALYWLTYVDLAHRAGQSSDAFGPAQRANMVATVAEIAIGLSLLLGAKGFSALLFRVRTAGLELGHDKGGDGGPQ